MHKNYIIAFSKLIFKLNPSTQLDFHKLFIHKNLVVSWVKFLIGTRLIQIVCFAV